MSSPDTRVGILPRSIKLLVEVIKVSEASPRILNRGSIIELVKSEEGRITISPSLTTVVSASFLPLQANKPSSGNLRIGTYRCRSVSSIELQTNARKGKDFTIMEKANLIMNS